MVMAMVVMVMPMMVVMPVKMVVAVIVRFAHARALEKAGGK
jgi:hypothetical protein